MFGPWKVVIQKSSVEKSWSNSKWAVSGGLGSGKRRHSKILENRRYSVSYGGLWSVVTSWFYVWNKSGHQSKTLLISHAHPQISDNTVTCSTVLMQRSREWICVTRYLHRDPASRRRRRKGKSQIWDSKVWSRVPSDSDPRTTALARASSIYKRETHPLVREGAQQK
jgi:hypothetical protein